MNSLIKWVGGKRLLRKYILNEFPQEMTSYVEVFGGAAWILFAQEKHAEVEVYNDVDHNLVNLFRCVKYHADALYEAVSYTHLRNFDGHFDATHVRLGNVREKRTPRRKNTEKYY